jgi:hypothetical protein
MKKTIKKDNKKDNKKIEKIEKNFMLLLFELLLRNQLILQFITLF